MEGYKILIVEDEATVVVHLRTVLELLGHRVTGMVGRVSEALNSLKQERPDLVLLDIKLRGEQDGIDLAARLRAEYHVPFVFLTSQANVSTVERAKQTHPYGYLVKPFDEHDIYVALELAFSRAAAERAALPPALTSPAPSLSDTPLTTAADGIFLRYRKQIVKIKFADLYWLSADRNYTTLYTATDKYTVYYALKYVEEHLPKADFVRVHKSYIVALHHITALDNENVIIGGQAVPIGRAYHATLMSRLNLLSSE